METLYGIIQSILEVLRTTWWVLLPIILFFSFKNAWFIYIHDRTVRKIKWTILEIKIPKDILTTPKAMEPIFAAVYADYTHGMDFFRDYWDGEVDSWYSFEIVGYAHGVHFYVYLPAKLRNSLEAAIYAQYPEVEIHEVEDYTELLPQFLPNKAYNLWGTDLILGRESFYPIRTYPFFEEAQEEKRLDPISAITEVMSNLKGEERIWWQVIVSPSDHTVGNDWKKQGEKKIDEIVGRKSEAKQGWLGSIAEFLTNLVWAPFEPPVWSIGAKKDTTALMKFLNPAEQEAVKAIDAKTAKLGLETKIRFIYIDRAETFSTANGTAVMGSIRQFNTQNLNLLKPGDEKTILSGWKPKFIPFYRKFSLFSRKKNLFNSYKARSIGGRGVDFFRGIPKKLVTMNTEELATVYHFPTMMVGAPKLRRLPSKKGEPPVSLPLEME